MPPVNMGIGDNRQIEVAASVPQTTESIGMQNTNTAIVGGGIELIVIDQRKRSAVIVSFVAEQKRARLVMSFRTAVQLANQFGPQGSCQPKTGITLHGDHRNRRSSAGRKRP